MLSGDDWCEEVVGRGLLRVICRFVFLSPAGPAELGEKVNGLCYGSVSTCLGTGCIIQGVWLQQRA